MTKTKYQEKKLGPEADLWLQLCPIIRDFKLLCSSKQPGPLYTKKN